LISKANIDLVVENEIMEFWKWNPIGWKSL